MSWKFWFAFVCGIFIALGIAMLMLEFKDK